MSRKHYTRDEVASITANPEGTAAVVDFMESHRTMIHTYDTGPHGEYIRAKATLGTWKEILQADFREFDIFQDVISPDGLTKDTKLINTVNRALSYSLPRFLADHVETVHNTVQILPRRSLSPGDREVNAFGASDDVGIFGDHVAATFPSTINKAYKISSNAGNRSATQGILSMIDDSYSELDLEHFSKQFNLPPASVTNFGGHKAVGLCEDNPGACAESNLDLQYMHAVAYDSHIVRIYASDPLAWLLNLSAMEHPPLVNSLSYGDIFHVVI
jgi:hypothetical protein